LASSAASHPRVPASPAPVGYGDLAVGNERRSAISTVIATPAKSHSQF